MSTDNCPHQRNREIEFAIFPVGGQGKRFQENEFKEPKPFINLFGKTQLEWSILSSRLNYPNSKIVIGCRNGLTAQCENLAEEVKSKLKVEINVMSIGEETKGAAHTVSLILKKISRTTEEFDFVVLDNDLALQLSTRKSFNNCSAGVVTTRSINTEHSFVIVDSNEHVLRIAEKERISDNGVAGNYYFKSSTKFMEYYDLISRSDREEFLSEVINTYLSHGEIVKTVRAPLVVSYGTPQEIQELDIDSLAFLVK